MTDDIPLPPLPNRALRPGAGDDAMREFARAAVLLDRQQRAAPSAEPVAWMYDCGGGGRMYADELSDPTGWLPLYTTPPDHNAVMRQALEALEERYVGALRDNAIDALRAALGTK
jgi:hypothetical protein